jgi:hypothetical protein
MSISFPLTTLFDVAQIADQSFQLQSRQELSRMASGITIAKDLGSALWSATFTTGQMSNDDALTLEAKLNSLDGSVQLFEAFDLRRTNPKAYPDGTGANNGTLLSVNANNKALALSGLAAGQVISAGDYLSFDYGSSRALHQVVEAVTANGSGVTTQFEVRPHIRTGWTTSPSTTVKLKSPRGQFVLLPNSVSSRSSGALHTIVSFQAIQFLQ